MEHHSLFTVRITDCSAAELLDVISRFIQSGKPHHIITANSLMLESARRRADMRRLFQKASLVLPDGAGVVGAIAFLSVKIIRLHAGIDLCSLLCRVSAERGYRVFFIGARQRAVERMVGRLKAGFPGLDIAGFHNGYFNTSQDSRIVRLVRDSRADILFVGMGFPKQEQWIQSHLMQLSVKVAIGVGGSFDVLSGALPRAPYLMRRLRMEWAYRMARQPRRMLMIPRLVRFLGYVCAEKIVCQKTV